MRKKKLVPIIKGPMSTVACRIPDDIVEYLDKRASQQLRTRSDLLRSLVVDALRAQNIVASEAEMDDIDEISA